METLITINPEVKKCGPYFLVNLFNGSVIPVSVRGKNTNENWYGNSEDEVINKIKSQFGPDNVTVSEIDSDKLEKLFLNK